MKKTIFGRYFQYVTAFIAMSSYITIGALQGWASPVISQVMHNETSITATPVEVSWIVSLLGFVSLLSNIPLLFVVNIFGRKKLLGFVNVPLIISWLMISCASTSGELMAARIVAGMSFAAISSIVPIYLSEIVEDRIRGAVIAASAVLLHLGSLFELCVRPLVSFSTLAAISTIFPAMFLLLFIWIPDTPYFYLMEGRRKRAEESLAKLRGRSDNMDELDAMQCFIDLNRQSEKRNICSAIRRRSFRRSALICLGLGVSHVLGAVAPLRDYSEFFSNMNINQIVDPNFSSIVMHLVTVVGTILASLLIDRTGRRPLMIASCSVCAVTLMAEGAFFFAPSQSFGWVPLVCHLVFKVFHALGLGPLPVIIYTEVFPSELRATAVVVMSFLTAVLRQMHLNFFPLAVLAYDPYFPLWATAAFIAMSLVFVIFLLPETKSKSFLLINLEIELSVKR